MKTINNTTIFENIHERGYNKPTTHSEKIYQIGLWPGMGYNLNSFNVSGTCDEDAIDNLVTYLVNNNVGEGRYWEELESLECEYSEDKIEEMGFTYIDATMDGANRPVFLRTMEMTIKEITH